MKLRTRKKRLSRYLADARRRTKRKLGWHDAREWLDRAGDRVELRAWLRDPEAQRATLFSWLGVILRPESLAEEEQRIGRAELNRRALKEMR